MEKKLLYVNTKAKKEDIFKSFVLLVHGVRPTKTVSKELMDKELKLLSDYLVQVKKFQIVKRNFHDISTKKRPGNFHPKFSTYIYKVKTKKEVK